MQPWLNELTAVTGVAAVKAGVVLGALLLSIWLKPMRSADLRCRLLAWALMVTAFFWLAGGVRSWSGDRALPVDVGLNGVPEGVPAPSVNLSRYTLAAAGKFQDIEDTDSGLWEPPTGDGLTLHWWAALWLTGCLLLLARLACRYLLLVRFLALSKLVQEERLIAEFASAGRELGLSSPVQLRSSESILTPLACGPPRATVVIPDRMKSSPAGELRIVFLHELAHVKRRDSLVQWLAEGLSALFWFHPLVWWARHVLGREQEMAADSVVINRGIRPSTYSSYLLRLLRMQRRSRIGIPVPASAMLGRHQVERRLRAILSPAEMKAQTGLPARLAMTVVALFAVLALSLLPNAVVAGSVAGEANAEGWTQESLHELLAPVFINKMADYYVAGAAITIVKDGELVYSRAFGNAEVFEEESVVPDRTLFRIGSVTKTMTGVAVMQLVDRGLLDLEANVNNYLSAFKIEERFSEPVRVKDLLTHTSGFDQLGYDRHVQRREDVLPLGEFLAGNLVRIRPVGEVSCYDTYAITLAGYLVEQVSGLRFEDYLKKNIFEPLGMRRTNIYVPPTLRGDVAVGYEFRGEWFPQRWEFMNTDPASTVNSTVVDMANYMRMLLAGGEFQGRRVLSPASVRAMLTPQYSNHPELPGFGYTFFEDTSYGVDAFSHGGSMTGFASFLYLVPDENLGLFVAYNQESGRLADQVIRRLVDGRLAGKVRPPTIRPRLDHAGDLSRFTGSYADNVYNHSRPGKGWRPRPFDLTTDGEGNLIFNQKPAHRVGPLMFQQEDGLLLVFRENHEGEITHLFVRQSVYEKL